MAGKYDNTSWKKLPEDVKAAATVLGYDKKSWDGDKEPELVKDSDWDELTKEQQAAAAVLGYSADNWEDDSSSSSSSDSD